MTNKQLERLLLTISIIAVLIFCTYAITTRLNELNQMEQLKQLKFKTVLEYNQKYINPDIQLKWIDSIQNNQYYNIEFITDYENKTYCIIYDKNNIEKYVINYLQ